MGSTENMENTHATEVAEATQEAEQTLNGGKEGPSQSNALFGVHRLFLETLETVRDSISGVRGSAAVIDSEVNATLGPRYHTGSALNGVSVYSYRVTPMVVPKVLFKMSKETVNTLREGIEPLDVSAVEDASRTLVQLEESVFFNGCDALGVQGLLQVPHTSIEVAPTPEAIVEGILKAAIDLRAHYVEGPYAIVVGYDFLMHTAQMVSGRTLASIIEDELGEDIQVSDAISGAVIFPKNVEDIALNISKGPEFTVEAVQGDEVTFALTEAFNVQVLQDHSAVHLTLKK